MRVYCMRHAESTYNRLRLCNDDPKQPVLLTQEGVSSAKLLAHKLRNYTFNIIFISSFQRTLQTARIINEHHNSPFVCDERLNDRVTGGFDGRSTTEFRQATPGDNDRNGNGESYNDVRTRIRSFLDDLALQTYQGVLIVTHREPMQAIAEQKLGYTEPFTNCSMIEFEI